MSQNIPIVLTPLPVPVGIEAITFDQLLGLVCQYIHGSISQNVSFFIQGSVAPVSNQGIFFNQTSNRFENWNNSLGAYVPISEHEVGDIKPTFISGDDLSNGWVALDGRAINSINGLTQVQKNNLVTIFGANANIPNYIFLAGLSGIPANGSFSNISNPSFQPVPGTISSLPIDASYNQTQIQNLRGAAETTADSGNSLQLAVGSVISNCESIIKSLNSSVNGAVTLKVFVGYPS